MNSLYGYKVVIRQPFAMYKSVVLFKKHRKKKNRTPRVKVFSRWVEPLKDGDVIQDNINHVLYMNGATFEKLKAAVDAKGGA